MRRFLPFAAGVGVLALLPAAYAPDRDALVEMLAELAVWSFVVGALSILMVRIRGQARLARSDPLTQLGNRRALDERFELPRTGTIRPATSTGSRRPRRQGTSTATPSWPRGPHPRRERPAGRPGLRWGGDDRRAPAGVGRRCRRRDLRAPAGRGRRRVRSPEGVPVRITFGWAGGGPATTLQDLTAQADADLIARKQAGGTAQRLHVDRLDDEGSRTPRSTRRAGRQVRDDVAHGGAGEADPRAVAIAVGATSNATVSNPRPATCSASSPRPEPTTRRGARRRPRRGRGSTRAAAGRARRGAHGTTASPARART